MFERFTNRARHTVVLAQEEARRMQHNYIGTEHILLGLLDEPEGLGAQALSQFGLTGAVVREDVLRIIGRGKKAPSGHIPFTPRAKKCLELSLREALALNHNYIGTEHILLGLIHEGEGVAAQVMTQHAGDLALVRAAMLDLIPSSPTSGGPSRRWLRRRTAWGGPAEAVLPPEEPSGEMGMTPAADASLEEAARLAGRHPVGSHHLLLAALADPDTAAARALISLGVDLDRARDALRAADVTGSSDELPEEAGRRQMVIRVSDDRLTIEATDQAIVKLGGAALDAINASAGERGKADFIRGDLPGSASLAKVWLSLQDAFEDIHRRATVAADAPAAAKDGPEAGPDAPSEGEPPGATAAG